MQQKIEGSIVDEVKEDGTAINPPSRSNEITNEWMEFPFSKIDKYIYINIQN